jgi:hypothetical protein
MKNQLGAYTVRSSVGLASWSERTPSTAAVRPTHCPACQKPGHPAGEPVRLVGHGLRTRQVRAALDPESPVISIAVTMRRYRCRDCGAAIQVLPAEILPRSRYSLTAMARAIGMVGFGERSVAETRQLVGDGQRRDWPALRRWHRPLGALGPLSPLKASGTARQRARRVATRLLAFAPSYESYGTMGRRAEIGASWLAGAPRLRTARAPTSKDQVGVFASLLRGGAEERRRLNDGRRGDRPRSRASPKRRHDTDSVATDAIARVRDRATRTNDIVHNEPQITMAIAGRCTRIVPRDGHRALRQRPAATMMPITKAARSSINYAAR